MKKYCRDCGNKLEKTNTGYFSETTGKPMYSYECMNTKCETGCSNNGYHQFNFFTDTCKRCGRVAFY